MSDNQSAANDSPRIEPTFDAKGSAKADPPRLELLPYTAAQAPPRNGASLVVWVSSIAAGLALIAGVSAAALYDHARQSTLLAAKSEETRGLAQSIKALKDRIDTIEATRSHDENADARKIAGELKSQSAAARDLANAVNQANARLDKLDRDHGARLDKLGDRLDHDATAKFADLGGKLTDLSGRIDRLEKRPVAVPPVAAATPAKPVAAAPAPRPTFAPAAVSNETTGAIERPLRGYWLVEAGQGYAVIDGRDGPQQVAPGDILPGLGRVQRIERRGGGWVVVTAAGVIAGDTPID